MYQVTGPSIVMACDPKEGTAVAHKLVIIIFLEIEHDFDSFIRRNIGSRSGAVRNAEAKNHLKQKDRQLVTLVSVGTRKESLFTDYFPRQTLFGSWSNKSLAKEENIAAALWTPAPVPPGRHRAHLRKSEPAGSCRWLEGKRKESNSFLRWGRHGWFLVW